MSEKFKSPEELEKLKEKYIMPSVSHYYEEPMNLVKGDQQYLYDSEGNGYLDCFAGILTNMSGYNQNEIEEKVVDQVRKLKHTSTVYLIQPMLELAEKLSELAPGNINKTFFVNSGTEATEGALMLAKFFTGSSSILALQHSYHGQSYIARGVTGIAQWKEAELFTTPGVHFVPNGYCYRCPFGKEYPSCNIDCARYAEEVIKTATPGHIAGIIAEPIQGVGGFVTPPDEYFKILYDIVKKYGGVYISDEVQTGFGRTGEKTFGIDHWGVEPDMMTFAKGMANGSPIGAYMATDEIADSFKGSNISTFGGNHVSSTAALANLNFIEEHNLVQNTAEVGRYLKEGLEDLKNRHKLIGDVRGKGLMLGVELVTDRDEKTPAPDKTKEVMEAAKNKGLLVGKGGLYGNVLRIAPPIIFDKNDCDDAIDILDRAISEV
ncbi:MAG: aspartate aminotransferase family protein [Halanaerobiales bacterium]|nr:aspartate aminotransferase family protein [Halanaerobiales bacterium]